MIKWLFALVVLLVAIAVGWAIVNDKPVFEELQDRIKS